jgi:superfamily II DNA helicase RecQ
VTNTTQFATRIHNEAARLYYPTVCIDDVHCVSLWGGSFHPDYAEIGVLRARLPPHVVMMIASATLPDHILDDIRHRISITKDAQFVALSNDRPNIALSVRVMKHSEESKADLRFLIPNRS